MYKIDKCTELNYKIKYLYLKDYNLDRECKQFGTGLNRECYRAFLGHEESVEKLTADVVRVSNNGLFPVLVCSTGAYASVYLSEYLSNLLYSKPP